MKVLIYPVDGSEEYMVKMPSGNSGEVLSSLQKVVGGFIETYPIDDEFTFILDEEGRLKRKAPNKQWPQFVGTVCVIKTKWLDHPDDDDDDELN